MDPILSSLVNGRTDRVFDLVAAGVPATVKDADGVPVIRWCAYFGDVAAIRFLLANGETMASLGENFELAVGAFHGHWQLCQFLIEHGANVNDAAEDTGETALHSTLCTPERMRRNLVMRVLLDAGADPHLATKPGVETGAFMRDCRTKGETALHRAAAFGDEESIDLLLKAGAKVDARDVNGDTPLSWASWYGRPNPILRKLLYGNFRIRAGNRGMDRNLAGDPQIKS